MMKIKYDEHPAEPGEEGESPSKEASIEEEAGEEEGEDDEEPLSAERPAEGDEDVHEVDGAMGVEYNLYDPNHTFDKDL